MVCARIVYKYRWRKRYKFTNVIYESLQFRENQKMEYFMLSIFERKKHPELKSLYGNVAMIMSIELVNYGTLEGRKPWWELKMFLRLGNHLV